MSIRLLTITLLATTFLLAGLAGTAPAQARRVAFPPAESKPPPPRKAPPKTKASGEDTGIIPDPGPSMRKTQERTPPPPTNLTVMYKVSYGETLEYVHPDGTVQKFEQWKSYPNDGFRLMSAVNQRLEDGKNYQYDTSPLSADGFDPLEIPLLFMAGDYDFVFTESEVANLRRYITDGGTILFNAARGRDEFNIAVGREMRKVLPTKPFMRVPLDHPIFNARYRIRRAQRIVNGMRDMEPPSVFAIDIGTRAAAILVPEGLGAAWSGDTYHAGGNHIVGESAIRLGVNLMAYVLGSTEYARFLAQEFPLYTGKTAPGDVFRFAEVRYAGSWTVNPGLQNTLLQFLRSQTGVDVDFEPNAVNLESRFVRDYPLLLMTGHYDFRLTREQVDNLAEYLTRGGRLLVTSAAGLKPFDIAFRRELARALPDATLIRIPPSHDLLAHGWHTIDQPQYTPAALSENPSLRDPELYGAFINGRLAVLYSPHDLMSGVNRESNAYAKGIVDEDATRIVVNAITYFMSH